MKLAVLGVGRIGRMHARYAVENAAVDEVRFYDVDAAAAAAAATDLGIRSESDLPTLLDWADGALIATPTPVHEQSVLACLAAGVPVLCEKPLALDPEVVERLADAADRAGVPLVVGFQRRFDPEATAIRAGIAAGEYGAVYLIRALAMDARPPSVEYIAGSGGIFIDQLVHDLDALPWLLGERVVRVSATGSVLVDPRIGEVGDVDTAVVVLTFASGALGVIAAGRRNGDGYDNRWEISAEHVSVTAGLSDRTPLRVPGAPGLLAGPAWPGFQERWETAYRAEITGFADVVAGRLVNPSPARDGLHALEIAAACRESMVTQRPVDITAPPGI